MNDSHSISALIDRFLDAFNSGDLDAMRSALADDAVAFVTGPDGNPVRLDGADRYIAALGEMHLTTSTTQLSSPRHRRWSATTRP